MKIIKKHKIFFLLMVIGLLIISGCDWDAPKESNNIPDSEQFMVVDKTLNYYIVYNKKTKVMYAISNGLHNRETFTRLDNADGTPLLYEDE